jgi:hypothetical protein
MGSDNGPEPAGVASAASASANEEEAARAKALGREALQQGDHARAIRLLRISERLVPNADTRGLLNAALAAQARTQGPQRQAQQAAAAAAAPRWSEQDLFGRAMNKVDAFHDAIHARLPPAATQWIERKIHPASRRPLAYVSTAIVVAAVYRFWLHGPALRLGHLPGDIYYRNANVVVSAPILSCLLFSVGMNVLARLFRGY